MNNVEQNTHTGVLRACLQYTHRKGLTYLSSYILHVIKAQVILSIGDFVFIALTLCSFCIAGGVKLWADDKTVGGCHAGAWHTTGMPL